MLAAPPCPPSLHSEPSRERRPRPPHTLTHVVAHILARGRWHMLRRAHGWARTGRRAIDAGRGTAGTVGIVDPPPVVLTRHHEGDGVRVGGQVHPAYVDVGHEAVVVDL